MKVRYERDTKDTLRLVIACIIIILLYLALTFKPVYGYIIASSNQISISGSDQQNTSLTMQTTTLPEKTTPDNNFGPDYNDYDIPDDPDKNPSAIPEPTTFVLMALGAGVVSALKKLKQ